MRVTPLLNVHRTEEQLKAANDELATLRAKLEKIDNERNGLKAENQKLEAKVSRHSLNKLKLLFVVFEKSKNSQLRMTSRLVVCIFYET